MHTVSHDGSEAGTSDHEKLRSERSGIPMIPVTDMLDILRLISRAEATDIVLEKVRSTIVKAFGIRALAICILDENTGMFVPKIVHGFSHDKTASIKRHAYSVERKRKILRHEFLIAPNTYYVPAESDVHGFDDDLDYVTNVEEIHKPRATPETWHALDYIDFIMTDRLGNWIGWIEIDEPADDKIPSMDVIDRVRVLTDLTAIAIENARTYEEAIQAVNEAQGYLDLIVHDMGNMVNPLTFYLNELEHNRTIDSRGHEHVSKARAISNSMRKLIDNVRKLSEVHSSQTLMKEKYDLKEVLVRCVSEVKRDFPSKDISVSIDCPECEVGVLADSLIYDLFGNLISNAVKYNPNKAADVEIGVVDGYSAWTVRIEDHGVGIPDEKKDKVFARFAKRPEGFAGTGMGLSIVSALVERYNGIVAVKDRVLGDYTQGCCFEVSLPKAHSQEMVAGSAGATVTGNGFFDEAP